jgi:hypothetical protein
MRPSCTTITAWDPADLQDDQLKPILHIDVWMTLWDELKVRAAPKPTDPFVFDDPVPFPRESVGRTLDHYCAVHHCRGRAGRLTPEAPRSRRTTEKPPQAPWGGFFVRTGRPFALVFALIRKLFGLVPSRSDR